MTNETQPDSPLLDFCGNCRFFADNACRRFPPATYMVPMDPHHPAVYHPVTDYPGVTKDFSCCGEFKPNEPETPKLEPAPPIWAEWDKIKPEVGRKIIVVCDDGCSATPCLVAGDGGVGTILLDGEDGAQLSTGFTNGAIWAYLPDDYELWFIGITD